MHKHPKNLAIRDSLQSFFTMRFLFIFSFSKTVTPILPQVATLTIAPSQFTIIVIQIEVNLIES